MNGYVVSKKINGWFKPERIFLNEKKAIEWANEKEFGVIGIPEFKVTQVSIEGNLKDYAISKDTGNLKGILVEEVGTDIIPVKVFSDESEAWEFIDEAHDKKLDVSRIIIEQ